ncbi:hypothetical protein SDRG_00722 [Saprolegnia diclina VS20]|uniref:Uncharacterized protein n=1 Tax=Saprolegnia diclina (strain VS20) TaxID=1156394 RepID=T0R4G8_SAPDV|nr:hypothetical protein SDRG_00722 [Saprolegnia diclina VS20]EQC41866.1 hypothetical protein SDRG_00722 [Saprolegnia diclina VS20]|eukprot:XP_008604435.1 hypothetical protein SDRG_00722 [Saprolegnia diclina VS20]
MRLVHSLVAFFSVAAATFVAVDPSDAFVAVATNEFMKTYDRFLSDVFAVVSDKTVLSAQVYKHPILLDDPYYEDEYEETYYMAGATYKLNVLLKLQFDSAAFAGDPYMTVANCVFVCTNDTDGHVDCTGKTFEQFPRVALPTDRIEEGPIRALVSEHLKHMYDDASFELTAYEAQNDSIHSDMVEYFRFTAEGEPVECEFAAYRDGSTSPPTRHMLYFDDKCIVAKYHGQSLADIEHDERLHTTLMLSTLALVTVIAACVALRSRVRQAKRMGYRHVRFQASETPRGVGNAPVEA